MKNGKTVLALVAGVTVGALAAKVIEDINDKKSLQKGGDLNEISLLAATGPATVPATVPSYFFNFLTGNIQITWNGKNFYSATPTKRIPLPTKPFDLIIDASANTMPSNLKNNSNLTSVFIDASNNKITAIAANSFQNCPNLTSVTLSPSITKIGASAFQVCTNLKNFTILDPSKLTSIGANAFNGCGFLNILITSQENMKLCYCDPYNKSCKKPTTPKNFVVGTNAFLNTPYNTSEFKIVPVPTKGNGTSPVCLSPV